MEGGFVCVCVCVYVYFSDMIDENITKCEILADMKEQRL
jgi:hypothetical protein